jgi:mannose/fructose/N-acetylgalactosamine-specific phosphotransferase system component IIC
LVIPLMIYNVIDSPTTYKIVDINNNESAKWKIKKIEGQKRSEWILFYICYLIPVLFATWRVVQFIQKLNKIEKKILNEQKKHLSN